MEQPALHKYVNNNENTLDAIELQEFEPTNANATPAHRSIVIDDPPSQERRAMSTHQSNAQRDVNTNFVA